MFTPDIFIFLNVNQIPCREWKGVEIFDVGAACILDDGRWTVDDGHTVYGLRSIVLIYQPQNRPKPRLPPSRQLIQQFPKRFLAFAEKDEVRAFFQIFSVIICCVRTAQDDDTSTSLCHLDHCE